MKKDIRNLVKLVSEKNKRIYLPIEIAELLNIKTKPEDDIVSAIVEDSKGKHVIRFRVGNLPPDLRELLAKRMIDDLISKKKHFRWECACDL